MPNNTPVTAKKKRVYKLKGAKPKKIEKLYKVTLTLSFQENHGSSDELEKGDHGYRDETNTEFCARVQDWNLTERAYGTNEKIQAHVKKNDARDFVEYLPPGEVRSAKWLDGFRIAFVFKPESPEYESVEAIRDWLQSFSLEDGEYESGDDNGWRVTTLEDKMEYGLTDYRDNPVIVEEVSTNVLSGGRRQTRRRR